MRCGLAVILAGVLAAAVPAAAEQPGLCQRGAVAPAVPMAYLLERDAEVNAAMVWSRIDLAPFEPGEDAAPEDYVRSAVLAEAIEWPGVLADAAAELPPGAHDLPWLLELDRVEKDMQGVVMVLATQPQSILLPDLLPLMERNGLTEQAAILRDAMKVFPEWELNPAERTLGLYDANGLMKDQRAFDRLLALDDSYPRDGAAMRAALALLKAEPDLARHYNARLDELDAGARLAHLMQMLRQDCVSDTLYEAAEIQSAYLSLGSAQAGLLMMDDLARQMAGEGSATYWIYDPRAIMAPHLLRVLSLRGNAVLAGGLQKFLAEFPVPFPDLAAREDMANAFSPEVWDRLDQAFPDNAEALLNAEMIALARDAGLLSAAP